MTRQEAIKMLANTKVYVDGKSREIQEKLFSLGFQWQCYGTEVLYTGKPFIFIKEDKYIYYSDDMEYFTKNLFREITANDILNIIIGEPKYRPFKNAGECLEEMKKHEPFGWVYAKTLNKFNNTFMQITLINDKGFRFATDGTVQKYENAVEFDFLYFADGTPFGIKVEEE